MAARLVGPQLSRPRGQGAVAARLVVLPPGQDGKGSCFQALCGLAGIRPKKDVETGKEEPWELKDLRKTCATYRDEHVPESSVETPGHSEGSVCLLVEGQGVLFAGDTLFRGSCGRCDFPGGDYRAMLKSLARLGALEGQYTVYPGHDSATDMDYERKYNPYMKQGMNV